VLSYKITSKQLSPQERKQHSNKRISPKDPDFKTKVLERVFLRLVFKEGMRVRLNGTTRKGTITTIHFDNDSIVWEANKPMFIEVLMDDKTRLLCGTHQLSRKKAK
jgi:hypothetical protein